MNYYNEHDPFAAAWLRGLIAAGLIPAGDVDKRSIEDVTPNDVAIYTSCHFFAGIGGWPYALRLAGWPDDRPVWTGSAPCQPFSTAGKGGGFADERHLWPAWFWLIRQCRPATIFGEQVSSKDGLAWFGVVSADLEAQGYAVGAADLCAAGVGAPHIRQRLYFVADADRASAARQRGDGGQGETAQRIRSGFTNSGGMGNAASDQKWQSRFAETSDGRKGALRGPSAWSAVEYLPCLDGKARPTQPGLQPLAHGVSARVGRLRGYGNAIVPPLAAEFIKAYQEAR